MDPLTPEITTNIIYGLVAIVISIIVLKSPIFQQNITKRHKKLTDSYVKDLEDELDYQKKEALSAKRSLASRDRGPSIKDGDWQDIVPELISGAGSFVPKKLQWIFEDKELSGAIVSKVMENPEKYKGIIKKFITKDGKTGENQTVQAEQTV